MSSPRRRLSSRGGRESLLRGNGPVAVDALHAGGGDDEEAGGAYRLRRRWCVLLRNRGNGLGTGGTCGPLAAAPRRRNVGIVREPGSLNPDPVGHDLTPRMAKTYILYTIILKKSI